MNDRTLRKLPDASVKRNELIRQYDSVLGEISTVIDAARRSAARSVNCIMTAAYWLIGRRIVEGEQQGAMRAEYGKELIGSLAADLSARYGRGFSVRNAWQMRAFYLAWPIPRMPSAESTLSSIALKFPLPWSAYVRLLSVNNDNARRFYEAEALRGGWSVRQLDRQINSQFYEQTAQSRNKAAMLTEGQKALPEDRTLPEEEIKDPFVLEFLGLKEARRKVPLSDPMARLTMKLIKMIPLFQALTEKTKTSISNRSRKLFTMSSIHQATRLFLRKERGEEISPDEEKLALDFWNEVIANMPDWIAALERKTTPAALRQNYVHAHGLTLQALAIAGHGLIRLYPVDWQTRLRELRTLDWRRTNTSLWKDSALQDGRVSRSRQHLNLTAEVIIRCLELPPDYDTKAKK